MSTTSMCVIQTKRLELCVNSSLVLDLFLAPRMSLGIFFQILCRGKEVGYEDLEFGSSEMVLVPVITGSFFRGLFANIGLILIGALLVALSFGAFG